MTQTHRKWTARLENPNGGLVIADSQVDNGRYDLLRETTDSAVRHARRLLQEGGYGTDEICVVLMKQLKADPQPMVDRIAGYVFMERGEVRVVLS